MLSTNRQNHPAAGGREHMNSFTRPAANIAGAVDRHAAIINPT
jgi:hypothetical protein